jgi:predicted Zn-dependent protease
MGCHFKKDSGDPSYIINKPGTVPVHIIPVYIEESFTLKDKGSIISAIDSWNKSLNGYIVLKVESTEFKLNAASKVKAQSDESYLILKLYSSNEMIVKRDEGTDFVTLGLANKVGGNWMYIIRDRLGDDDITPIAMHELAHLLGADHTDRYLMNRTYIRTQYKCIDADTIKQVADKWMLPMKKLNYCNYD